MLIARVQPQNSSTSPTTAIIEDPKPCKRGTKIGQILITQPNASTIWFVGAPAWVVWSYTPLVTQPPKTIDIKIQSVLSKVSTWDTFLVKSLDVSNGATAYLIPELPRMLEGGYKLKVVPDGKEIAGKRQDEYPCFGDGEGMPGVSAEFQVTRTREIVVTKDRFPPTGLKEPGLQSWGVTFRTGAGAYSTLVIWAVLWMGLP
ncbi:hypothetical protein HDV05_000312 [Chytridiales sp. JEL 0842]|nr:hypothetical protein HDV05_000312 [Chytridiales sp. JEL 0842]